MATVTEENLVAYDRSAGGASDAQSIAYRYGVNAAGVQYVAIYPDTAQVEDESDWSDLEQHGLTDDRLKAIRQYLISSGQASV